LLPVIGLKNKHTADQIGALSTREIHAFCVKSFGRENLATSKLTQFV
jgi:hypothetical protein